MLNILSGADIEAVTLMVETLGRLYSGIWLDQRFCIFVSYVCESYSKDTGSHQPKSFATRLIRQQLRRPTFLWLYGPLFLHGSRDRWITQPRTTTSNLEQRTNAVNLSIASSAIGDEIHKCNHSNSFYKAYMYVAFALPIK